MRSLDWEWVFLVWRFFILPQRNGYSGKEDEFYGFAWTYEFVGWDLIGKAR